MASRIPVPMEDLSAPFACCSRALGSRKRVRSVLRAHVFSSFAAALIALCSSVVDTVCANGLRCHAGGVSIGAWMRFVAFLVFVQPPTALVDTAFFAAVAETGSFASRHSDLLSTVFFYVGALEGGVGGFLWLLLALLHILGSTGFGIGDFTAA